MTYLLSPLSGIRVYLGALTDITEANALSFNNSHVSIYSNSWGPIDNGFTVGGPEWATIQTLKLGVEQVSQRSLVSHNQTSVCCLCSGWCLTG